MLKPRVELAIAIAFVGWIVVGLFFTSRIDLAFSSDLETFSGPRAYPGLILCIMLMLFGVIGAIQLREVLRDTESGFEYESFFSKRSVWSAALFVALFVFVLTFESVGYILTMVPLLTVVALLCGAKNALRAFIVAVCLTVVCLVIFRYGLSTVLPEGIFGIDAVF